MGSQNPRKTVPINMGCWEQEVGPPHPLQWVVGAGCQAGQNGALAPGQCCYEGGLHYNQCNKETRVPEIRELETPTSTPKDPQLGFKPNWDSKLGQRRP